METLPTEQDGAQQSTDSEDEGRPEEASRGDAVVASARREARKAINAARALFNEKAARGLYECPDVDALKALLAAAEEAARDQFFLHDYGSKYSVALIAAESQRGLKFLDGWFPTRRAYYLSQTDNLDVLFIRRHPSAIVDNTQATGPVGATVSPAAVATPEVVPSNSPAAIDSTMTNQETPVRMLEAPASPSKRGAHLKPETAEIIKTWEDDGRPWPFDVAAKDKIAEVVFPVEFRRAKDGSILRKRLRDRVRVAIHRHRRKVATQ